MIPTKIKALFQFIEYLHSNIDSFNLNNDLINELELLSEEREKVSSKRTFIDKLKYDEVQAEIVTKFKILQGNTANLIKAKVKELNVCNFDNERTYSFNGIEIDIRQLKEHFSKDDLPEIFKHKQQYIEYRTKTHKTFLSLMFFFSELDEITKSLFDYFKETELNEFEAFETKAIQINNISEAVKLFKKGQTKFTLSNSFLNPSTIKQQAEIENSKPQQIVKQKTEQNIKLITFKNSETIEKIHSELKGYFLNKEAELLKALQGEQLSEILLFPHNQNKFVEVFRRLKYNGFLLNTDTETKNWICTTFQFIKKGYTEPQPFNENTVWNNLNKGKGEPTKKERICITDWLPFKNQKTLEEEAQREKL